MAKPLLLAMLLALAACSGMPQATQPSASACTANPASFDCQVEMYSKAGM